ATSNLAWARCSASSARSTSTLVSPLVSRCSARSLALRARSTSISDGRSAVSARIVTLSGSTSAKPQATASRCSLEFSRKLTSPTASSVISGACPGNIPRYPFLPGIWISSAALVSTTFFSGVTISSWKTSAIQNRRQTSDLGPQETTGRLRSDVRGPLLCCCLHLLRRFQHFFDRPLHVKRLLGDIVVLAFDDRLEALHRVGDLHVAPRRAGELLGHVERLR